VRGTWVTVGLSRPLSTRKTVTVIGLGETGTAVDVGGADTVVVAVAVVRFDEPQPPARHAIAPKISNRDLMVSISGRRLSILDS
jgi:hypothetical protein